MEKLGVGRKSSQTVPVIIENYENPTKKTKLMIPFNYTGGHLVNILRSRNHLLPYHPIYLFLKSKQSPVLMSKCIGHLYRKHRDDKGLLRLIHAEQGSFGFRGNIRAIRFRQKWLEAQHNTSHQDAGGPPSYSGAPPPYFPLDHPTSFYGAPFNLDDENESLSLPGNNILEYVQNTFLGIEDSLPDPDPDDDVLFESYNASFSPDPLAHSVDPSSFNGTLSDFEALNEANSIVSNQWPPSAATNSEISDSAIQFIQFGEQFSGSGWDQQSVESYNLFQALTNLSPPAPNISVNAQSSNVPITTNFVTLYESDSDFYDSDKDVDMDK